MSSTAQPANEGDIYTTISYQSNAFPQSEPSRLFGLARMFGLAPPAVETMRVLELGSSSGGNIIPLAARYPGARFLGIDLAPRHVAEARERIAAASLSNVEVRQGDITKFDAGGEKFDAVVCHGVYSWVPTAARSAILEIAAGSLSENGVAYVSYNVYPGWHLRSIIRDMMLYHAGGEGTLPPADRIAKARWVIENVSKIAHANSPYGAKLREEAAALAGFSDAYILGEFLAPYNEPCYFRDFHAAAERAGLAFLCEADIETCLPETHGEQVAQLIRTMSANQLVPMEQYIDFFMGRQFRQTLMVRKDQEHRIVRNLQPARIEELHVHGRLQAVPDQSTGGRFVYRTPANRTVSTTSLAVRHALDRLVAAFPESRTAGELAGELASLGVAVTSADRAAIVDVLFKMLIAGIVKPSSAPVRSGRADAQRFVAFPLARADVAAGRQTTANLKHETTAIDAVNMILLPLLDGTSNRMKLRKALLRAAEERRITVTDDQTKMPLQGAALERAVNEHVDLALQRLAEMALLLPAQ